MFHIKQELEQPDHLQQKSLRPPTSRLREHYSESLPTASSSPSGGGQDMCIVFGEGAARDTDTRQDTPTTDMASCGMAEYSSPPSYATVPCTYPEGVSEHQRVNSSVNQGNDQLGHALQREIPDPTPAAITYPLTHHAPPRGPPTAGDLRQLANHYMEHPGSQVDAVCTERSPAGGYKVTIVLEVTY